MTVALLLMQLKSSTMKMSHLLHFREDDLSCRLKEPERPIGKAEGFLAPELGDSTSNAGPGFNPIGELDPCRKQP